jgi:hypothetical protein
MAGISTESYSLYGIACIRFASCPLVTKVDCGRLSDPMRVLVMMLRR